MMKITDRYKNKFFSILGDSISTLGGFSEPFDAAFYDGGKKVESGIFLPEDTWWGIVIDALGAQLLKNNSISGSMVSDHPCCLIPSYGCSDERTSSLGCADSLPDVIMLLIGTNDWGCGVKPEPENDSESTDPCVFLVAYEMMIAKIRNNYPKAEIWCLTLPVSTTKQREIFDFPYRSHGKHIDQFCEVIRNTAKKHECRLIDVYSDLLECDTIDGFHPNIDGMKKIAAVVLENVNNCL